MGAEGAGGAGGGGVVGGRAGQIGAQSQSGRAGSTGVGDPSAGPTGGVGGTAGTGSVGAAAGDVAAGVVGAIAGAVAAVQGRATQAPGTDGVLAPTTGFGPGGVQPAVTPVLKQATPKRPGTTGQGAAVQTSGRRRAGSTLLSLGLANTTRKTLLGV